MKHPRCSSEETGRKEKKHDGYCYNAPRLCYAPPWVPTRAGNYMQHIYRPTISRQILTAG
jgi:hypothetical protein